MQAKVIPPAAGQRLAGTFGYASALLVEAVVETVSVADPDEVPVMLTGLVAPKLKVGKY
jgi:hypothetical protein